MTGDEGYFKLPQKLKMFKPSFIAITRVMNFQLKSSNKVFKTHITLRVTTESIA
jgi:hypothetical protein